MDITYIPMARGFLYLAVVLDWFSRRVLSWWVSRQPGPPLSCAGRRKIAWRLPAKTWAQVWDRRHGPRSGGGDLVDVQAESFAAPIREGLPVDLLVKG